MRPSLSHQIVFDVPIEIKKPRRSTKTALTHVAAVVGFNRSATLKPIPTICNRLIGWEIGVQFAAQRRVSLQTMSPE